MGGFVLTQGIGFANAVRRTLTQDVEAWAPAQCTISRNTSCATDEYIAHRIGMIPFRCVGNGTTMTLRARGPRSVYSREFTGPGFEAVHGDIEVMRLGPEQELTLEVEFEKHPASKHARYAVCAGVGMEHLGGDRVRLNFTCNDGRAESAALQEALTKLDARVQRALHALANDPERAPQSFC